MDEERLRKLSRFVENARTQLADVERTLDGIEEIIEAERAHTAAQNRDARRQLSTGETHRVVIIDPPSDDGSSAYTQIDGIATFIAPQGMALDTGDTVRIKLVDIGETYAHAVATERVDDS